MNRLRFFLSKIEAGKNPMMMNLFESKDYVNITYILNWILLNHLPWRQKRYPKNVGLVTRPKILQLYRCLHKDADWLHSIFPSTVEVTDARLLHQISEAIWPSQLHWPSYKRLHQIHQNVWAVWRGRPSAFNICDILHPTHQLWPQPGSERISWNPIQNSPNTDNNSTFCGMCCDGCRYQFGSCQKNVQSRLQG